MAESLEDFLAHYGVKGMQWGVRKTRDGGAVLKVKGRPTYTTEERRAAQAAVKTAKKSGSVALDKEGFDQSRLAAMRTPSRRVVNGLLGTKFSNISYLATVTTSIAALAATGGTALPVVAVGYGAMGLAGGAHVAYRTFFKNMVVNPKVKVKTKLSPEEMAQFQMGKDFRKQISGKHGSVKFSVIKGKTSAQIYDREGRSVGGQTSKKAVRALKAPKPVHG